MDKKISIVIPVYNVEKYVQKCLETVINQSYKNIEIIVIMDGSTDSSVNIVETFAEMDSRINLIKRENKGVMETRLEGIRRATGNFIIFIDADDWVDVNMCDIFMKYQEKYNADIVKCSQVTAGKKIVKGAVVSKEDLYVPKCEYKEKIYEIFIENSQLNSMCGMLIKKEVAENIKVETNVVFAEDLNFNYKLYTESNGVVLVTEALYYYRENLESVTKKMNYQKIRKHFQDAVYVYSKLYEYLKIWGIDTEENRKRVSLRVLKEITVRILYCYRVKELNNFEIDNILELMLKNDILDIIEKYIEKKDIELLEFNKKFVMKAIYTRKKWKINFYGRVILYNYLKVKDLR